MSTDHGAAPVIPSSLLPYQSYTLDPVWQTRFTYMWCAALGAFVLLNLPRTFTPASIRENLLVSWRGVGVDYTEVDYNQDAAPPRKPVAGVQTRRRTWGFIGRIMSLRLWCLPGLPLNMGQITSVAIYAVFVLVSTTYAVPLTENPNRAGFLALAQLPPVFLFASKNSPLTALLLPPGTDYTRLNYIHRWAGRLLVLCGLVHGTMWINNHLIFGLPILTQQKEGSGVAALAVLLVLVLSSLGIVRRWAYATFLVIHYLTFPAFFVTICYHTVYAIPWIFPAVALYTFDLTLRFFRWRVVASRIEAKNGMSLIHIPHAKTGWRAGQHVQLRAVFNGRAWESHPLSICCASPEISCLRAEDGTALGMMLGARACGDWSRALLEYAQLPELSQDEIDAFFQDDEETCDDCEKTGIESQAAEDHDSNELPGRLTMAVLEGPYGGPTLRATDFEKVLLMAGGSGATFTLGVLDELIGRATRGERVKTREVVWVWCVRSFGAINWFAPHLQQIAARAASPSSPIRLKIRIFVTCLCDPDAVPDIHGCLVREALRPSVGRWLDGLVSGTLAAVDAEYASKEVGESDYLSSDADLEKGAAAVSDSVQGGVAVFAAGPGSLLAEAGNAVVAANLSGRARACGGVEFCGEAFKCR
ncbi:unnamed protein product [Mycena citricolor]|uniref:FAD-binding FR-type domain-containing protein n=1 Tax=Mycena citricolor TaxID=2018698 RepID=A0AAD2HJ52_9AGAR|nr:unnamed protein product [Mycena citricolor]